MNLVFVALWGLAALAAEPTSVDVAYLDELLAEADLQRLHEERAWQVLLHYRDTLTSGRASEIDGEDFFLATSGKTDPRGELRATLISFFAEGGGDEHAQCRFVARYAWLRERLHFDPQRLPPRSCPAFELWQKTLDAGSMTLVFSSAYLNAPASMYGHTFLRVNRRTSPSDLLATAVSFAAEPTTLNPVLYTIMGLGGGFPGRFTALPYYMKIEEYSNFESRDLWEYDLTLSQASVDAVLRHLWELDSTYFDYFFSSENCSYHLLGLLDVGLTGERLALEFSSITTPIDSLRAVLARPGLAKPARFRPSLASRMNAYRRELSGKEAALAAKLARTNDADFTPLALLPRERQALVLEAAGTYWRYKYQRPKTDTGVDARAARAREQKLLAARGALRVTIDPPKVPAPAPPERGHATSRLGAGIGARVGGEAFATLGWRLALHDLLDDQRGYTQDSELEMGSLRLRIEPQRAGDLRERTDIVVVDRFEALSIVSFAPWRGFVRMPSWRVSLGYGLADEQEPTRWSRTAARLAGGPGLSTALFGLGHHLVYVFGDLELAAGPAFRPSYRVAASASLGAILEPLPSWRLAAEGSYGARLLGDERARRHGFKVNLSMGLQFSRTLALRLVGTATADAKTGLLELYHYYGP